MMRKPKGGALKIRLCPLTHDAHGLLGEAEQGQTGRAPPRPSAFRRPGPEIDQAIARMNKCERLTDTKHEGANLFASASLSEKPSNA